MSRRFTARLRAWFVAVVLVTIVRVLACSCVASCAGVPVETDLVWREKKLERQIREDVESTDRYVDIGAIIKVVVRDDDAGAELVPGKPKLRVIREHGPFGGMLDTRANPPRIVDRSKDPVVWYASEDQEIVLLHDDPNVPGQLIWGSEGAGKTRVLAMIHYFWWLELLGEDRVVGQSAPTKKRLKHVLEAMAELYPASWFRYHKAEQIVQFVDGHSVQFGSTKRLSEAQGSPWQGHNLSKCGRDELQDQLDAHEDLESRGRSAKIDPRNGKIVYGQAATCTAKQSSDFMSLVSRLTGSGRWVKRQLLISRSPFIHPSFLEEKKLVMTDREFRRRYLCEDLPPEHMVYFNWSRALHLRPIPHTAKKITSIVLQRKTKDPRHALLGGNDPGLAKAATILLDAYEVRGIVDPVWWVRGELFTTHKTNELHAQDLLELVQSDRFGMNVPRGVRGEVREILHLRTHPYGQALDKPSLDVYRIFRRVGIDVRAAQYTRKGTGTGLIKPEDRIEMLNTLMLDAAGRTRFYVEADAHGQPVAPRLVASFESMERDDAGEAETERKDVANDKSDPPAACAYGLWQWEREAAQLARILARRREGRA